MRAYTLFQLLGRTSAQVYRRRGATRARPTAKPAVRHQARCAEAEAERDALAETAGVTPEHCRAAKAQLFAAAKLCAHPRAARQRP